MYTNKCEICAEIETSEHYFFRCNRFFNNALIFLEPLVKFIPYMLTFYFMVIHNYGKPMLTTTMF